MKKSRIPQQISDLSDNELRTVIGELQNATWDDNSPLRELSLKIYNEDYVTNMLALAVPLAVELEKRTRSQ